MKFNWNNVVAAVGFMNQDESIKGPLQGAGYSVTRKPKKKGKNQYIIVLTEGDYQEEGQNADD